MQKRRFTLLSALLASLALHVFVIGGGELTLPDFYSPDDEVLERKEVTHVQRVQLATRPPAPPEPKPKPPGLSLSAPPAKAAPTPEEPAPAPEPEQPAPSPQPAASEPAPDVASAADAPPAAPTDTAPPEAMPAVVPEPAPAFPVQLVAQLDARIGGIPVLLHQRWTMEGFRYFIDQSARKFGFRARMTSEGRVSPEGGLLPEHSQNLLNDDLKSFSTYRDGVIRYGKPGSPHEAPLPIVPQDMASLPFHLAVTFSGRSQAVMVTTGRKVYQVRFHLDAEEKIRLPTGTLRTLRLYGERYDHELRDMVRAYEVWLAPDYLNYPVKVVGHSSSGERFEYRIRSLEIEGKVVLGARDDDDVAGPEEGMPDWLQRRVNQESLNRP